MPPSPSVSVVLPALNEAANIGHVLAALPAVDEVIVVDGGSSDDTAAVAHRARPGTLIMRQTRTGKGNALACGIAASQGDIVVLMSADGSCDPGDIPRFVQALSSGAQAAHGSRFRTPTRARTPAAGGDLADRVVTRWVNDAFNTRYTDTGCGYFAFWRNTLDGMELPDTNAAGGRHGDGPEIDTLMAVRMAARGLRVAEIATVRYPRIDGLRKRSRAVGRMWEGWRTVRAERRGLGRGKNNSGYRAGGRPTLPQGPGERTTGRHARPEAAAARRPYPGPRPDWADAVGQHRTEDIGNRAAHRFDDGGSIRRSGIYESGVHRADDDGGRRHSAIYDTGVHRTGVYDSGVHRTEIYDTGAHDLSDSAVEREVGGGRRRLDARDRRTHGRPGPTVIPGDDDPLRDDDDVPFAGGRPGHLRSAPGER